MFRFDKSKVALANRLTKVQEDNEILRAENRTLRQRYSAEYVTGLIENNYKLQRRVYELETALLSLEGVIERIIK